MPIETNSPLALRLQNLAHLRVALVHDWLLTYRGGERVLSALGEMFPNADIFTLFYRPEAFAGKFDHRRIRPSRLSKLPGVKRYYRWLLPVLPATIEAFDFQGYDLVVSSSHCVAKGVIVPPGTVHVSYCHTTMRYVWDQRDEYFRGWKRLAFAPILHYLRLWDSASSTRVDRYLANSSFVAQRIQKYYRRESTVVHPFVDLETFVLNHRRREEHYLCVSALVPYKRIELAIEACKNLGRKLRIVGDGPELKRLKKLAGAQVEFIGACSNEELAEEYSRARALIFPGVEDFGITPLEAMACGTPVVGLGIGGLCDSVIDGVTGVFCAAATAPSLAEAIRTFESRTWDPELCRARAEKFARARFQEEVSAQIQQTLAERSKRIEIEVGASDRPSAPTLDH